MKQKVFLILFLIVILLANISFASYSTITMSVVEEPICTIDLAENSKFEKKLVSKDLANKEVTLQLKVTNDATLIKPTGELMIVLDNSNSMTKEVSNNKTRKDLIFESAISLINTLLKDNDQLKIGLVAFSTNTDISKEGTLEDASVISSLSNNPESLKSAINNIQTDGPKTDLEAGLQLASQQFTGETTNKYMIVLTDGVPNVAVNFDNKYYSDDVISKTKKQLQAITEKNINLITMLTGIDDETYIPPLIEKSFKQIIDEIFGTTIKPTAGKFYYITDDKIEQTITNNIYKSLMPISKTLTNIKIVDYFPDEIIKNFDFSYVSKASKGDISAAVDTKNNSITWNIPELSNGETAVVQYKLKLKQNFDNSIVDKILNTNQKVDISYTDFDEKQQSKTSDISPKLKLTEPKTNPSEPKNEVLPSTPLPHAGIATLIGLGLIIISFAILSTIKFINFNKKTR